MAWNAGSLLMISDTFCSQSGSCQRQTSIECVNQAKHNSAWRMSALRSRIPERCHAMYLSNQLASPPTAHRELGHVLVGQKEHYPSQNVGRELVQCHHPETCTNDSGHPYSGMHAKHCQDDLLLRLMPVWEMQITVGIGCPPCIHRSHMPFSHDVSQVSDA